MSLLTVRSGVRATLLAASTAFAPRLFAQPSYSTSYSVTAGFQCHPFALSYQSGSCTSDGKTLSITNGGQTVSFSFTPISSTLVATPIGKTIELGTLFSTVTGDGSFAYPQNLPGQPPFQFLLSFVMSIPEGGQKGGAGYALFKNSPFSSTTLDMDLYSGGGPSGGLPSSWDTPIPGYRLALDHAVANPSSLALGGSIVFTTQVGLMPEPSTLMLTGSGLLGVIILVLRKRRSA